MLEALCIGAIVDDHMTVASEWSPVIFSVGIKVLFHFTMKLEM